MPKPKGMRLIFTTAISKLETGRRMDVAIKAVGFSKSEMEFS